MRQLLFLVLPTVQPWKFLVFRVVLQSLVLLSVLTGGRRMVAMRCLH